MRVAEKRAYNAENREIQAAQTRARILEAAKELFQTEGFDRVTINRLAQAAKVSMPTIYALFKSKRGVLQALIDSALPPSQFDRLVASYATEKSPKKRLCLTARIARQIYDAERELGSLMSSASVVGPEFEELEKEREQRRYARQGEGLKKLLSEKVLAKGLTLAKVRDIQWALTGRDIYKMLVIERGWSSDDYEKWLSELLVKTLLNKS